MSKRKQEAVPQSRGWKTGERKGEDGRRQRSQKRREAEYGDEKLSARW